MPSACPLHACVNREKRPNTSDAIERPPFAKAADARNARCRRGRWLEWRGSSAQHSDNRMVLLLRWDARCFVGCMAIFFFLSLVQAVQEAGVARYGGIVGSGGGGGSGGSGGSGGGGGGALERGVLSEAFVLLATRAWWDDPQRSGLFFLFRILFACSSGLPFLAFLIPQVRALFSHTAPTGYDQHGVCVAFDGYGLSAQLLCSAVDIWPNVMAPEWGQRSRRGLRRKARGCPRHS